MKFQSPAQAPAHQSLIAACTAAGFDALALRRLLWLINAHPLLVAHAQVFEHAGALLESAQTTPGVLREQGLIDEAPEWIELCRWISSERVRLTQMPGLALLDRKPQHERDHPLLRYGVARHGIVAALWNRHQSTITYPPDDRTPIARAYFHLQMHTLAAYLHARLTYRQRHRRVNYGGMEHYEHYEGLREWPIAPSPTSDVGLAIRELSLSAHDAIVQLFPTAQAAEEYADALSKIRVDPLQLPTGKPEAITRYMRSLSRYFGRYGTLLRRGIGYRYMRRRRLDPENTGVRQRRPGYVNMPDVPGVFVQDHPEFDLGDRGVDTDSIPVTTAFIAIGLEDAEETSALEATGLSPAESLEPALQLYAGQELGTKLARLRRQQLAIEMQAQSLPFSYSVPTAAELRTLHRFLLHCLQQHLDGNAQNRAEARLECMAALILLTMLALGQPLSRIRDLRFEAIDTSKAVTLQTKHTTLVLDAEGGRAAGFWIPAIGPAYKTELSNALNAMHPHPPATGFLLPDTLGAGAAIADFLATVQRPNNRAFGIEPGTATQTVEQLLRATGLQRLTHPRIAHLLPTLIASLGADPTAQWLLCSESTRSDEPRLFYTQHRVDTLVRLYQRASHRLARQLGIVPAIPALSPIATDPEAVVGARFVAPADTVRELVCKLTAEIHTSRRTPLFGAPLVDYHASYTLYTWLFQALSTSIRALTSPRANALFSVDNATGPARAFDAALSDKDDERSSRARLALIDEPLSRQLRSYRSHVDNLLQRLQPQLHRAGADEWQPLVVLDERRRFSPLTPSWVAAELEKRGAPLPANFHRAFLRTELLRRGVAVQVIDAFLGHFNVGESPFGRFSSFDYGLHRAQLLPALQSLHEELALVPLRSRLLHHLDRRG